MDVNSIKNIVFSSIRFAWEKVRETMRLPYAKTYCAAALLLTLFFIILTFPYGELIKTQIQKMGKTTTIGAMDISFIGKSTASNIVVAVSNEKEITIKNVLLDINLNPYSLLISNHFTGSIQLDGFEFTGGFGSFTSRVNGNIDVILKPEGRILDSGTIKMMFEEVRLSLNKIDLPAKFGGLPLAVQPMKFQNIQLNFNVNNDNAVIDQFKLSGPDLRGSVSGSIKLGKSLLQSMLNLTISIESESPALETYRDFFTPYINADGNVVIPVQGSLINPSFSPQKEASGEDFR